MAPEGDNRFVALRIDRSKPGKELTEYMVAVGGLHSRVLDALLRVRHQQDPTLTFRYACRVGMCGSCAMMINGRERLACQTSISELRGTITVAPLCSLPVQKDLVVDMAPFFDTFRRVEAALIPETPDLREIRKLPPASRRRSTIERQNGCITCGACFSACEWTRWRKRYIGPAAMNRVFMLMLDDKDRLKDARLASVSDDDSALRCHTIGDCSVVCPVDVPLRTGLQRLRGMIAKG
jgi:succinate dehydrogenase/fumarate reductase iron-sulfur protein